MSKIHGYSKICVYCKKPFEAKNKNAKYCCNGHRVTDFKIRHGIPLPDFTIKQIRNRIPSMLEKDVAEKTITLQGIDNEIHKNKEEMVKLNGEYSDILDIVKMLDNEKHNYNKPAKIKLKADIHKSLIAKKVKDTGRRIAILKYPADESWIREELNIRLNAIELLKQQLSDTNTSLIEKADYTCDVINQLRKGYNIESLKDSGKIISASELMDRDMDVYTFGENFENIFGSPAKSFRAMIHGDSGSGKSSFCIKFADYFSKNHGDALYLSLEENTSVSFQIKLKNNTNGTPNFGIGFEREPKKIRDLSKNYKLVVVDSMSGQAYTGEDVEEITRFGGSTDTAFLFIMHETKAGVYKGDTYFHHLSDIFIEAKDGKIKVTKNRYLASNVNEQPEYILF